MTTKIENVLIKILLVFSMLMYVFLFAFSFFFSWENTSDLSDEHVYRMNDSLILNVGGLIIAALFVFLLGKFFLKLNEKKLNIVALIVAAICAIFSIYWVFASGTAPQADQMKICNAASQINAGDYSTLEKGGYLAECPHQLGIVTLIRILYTIFGDGNYKSFQVLSAVSIFLLILSGYNITKKLSSNNTIAAGIYLIISVLCFPLFFYTAFVYGEIISTALLMFSFWMMLALQEEFKISRLILFFVGLVMAILVRQNSLIAVIAIVGVLVVKTILEKDKQLFVATIAVILAVVCQSAITSILYSSHTPDDAYSMPAILYIAMGTNDAGGYSGWYDGSNFEIFEGDDCDPEAATEDAIEVIEEAVEDYAESPKEAVMFYIRKICAQWSAPMYQSIAMNNNIVDEQTGFASAIYYNSAVKAFLDGFMNVHQIVVFLAIIMWMIKRWKDTGALQKYVVLITIFGGFLFSIIWEAKSRYVFPYYVMMLPIAAVGLYEIYDFLRDKQ